MNDGFPPPPAHEDPARPRQRRGTVPMPQAAVDGWLRRSLHDSFDATLNEPIPPELMHLLEGRGEAD